MGSGCRPLPCAVRRVRDLIAEYPGAVKKLEALHWAPHSIMLERAQRLVGGTLDTMGPRGSKHTRVRYSAPSLSEGGGASAEKNGAGAGERPDDDWVDGASWRETR